MRLISAAFGSTPETFREVQEPFVAAIKRYHDAVARHGRKDGPTNEQLDQLREEYFQAEASAATHSPKWDALELMQEVTPSTSISEALERVSDAKLVWLVGRVAAAADPEGWEVLGRVRQGYTFTIQDSSGREIDTALMLDGTLWGIAEISRENGVAVELLATPVCIGSGKRPTTVLACHRIRRLSSELALVGASAAEVAHAFGMLMLQATAPGGLLPFILAELRELHSVTSAGLSPGWCLAEQAVVLQAASIGQLPEGTSPRLHILVVGPPASGKKLLALAVKALEPVALSAQAATLTRAGLAARAERRKDGLSAKAGLLPEAHLGAVTIEDLHGLRPAERDQVFGVLNQALEDGMVTLSNAASQAFACDTAVYFDLNRRSQLKADNQLRCGGARAQFADLGFRLDTLTRVDVVVELPELSGDADATAEAMLDRATDPALLRNPARRARLRALRVLIALLRHQWPSVDLTPVQSRMRAALRQLFDPLRDCRSPDLNPDSFKRRMSNSIYKLVAASARLRNSGIADENDVALAVSILEPKVEFIRAIATAPPDPKDPAGRRAAIERLFSGRPFTPKQVMDAFGWPRRTVMRDLDEWAIRTAYGRYRIASPRRNCASGTPRAKPAAAPTAVGTKSTRERR